MAVTKITGAGLGLPNADGNALGGASNEWSDLTMSADWKTYRQALRDLPANTADPTNITWPEEPGA